MTLTQTLGGASLLMLLGACATPVAPPQAVPRQAASSPTTDDTAATRPLPSPLTQEAAVALSLELSPALRALNARSQAQTARLRADSRPGLLGLSLSRLRQGGDTEIERHLSLGLLDLLLWPWRSGAADRQIEVQQQALALSVLSQSQAVRQQWLKAVGAQARLRYQSDVLTAAQTSAELARRLQASGQFSLAQSLPYAQDEAESRVGLSQASQQARSEREALVRLIGLNAAQAASLSLPDQLPPLPAKPGWTADQVGDAASSRRLDVRLAQARWLATRGQASSEMARSLVDVEVGYQRNTASGTATDAATKQGPTLGLRLVSIDFGAAQRQAVRLEEQAALADWQQRTLSAESQLRERWGDYEAAYATAHDAREVMRPLREQLLGERLKQYNGMLIGPLELLSEARSHALTVLTTLDALRDFWLADAALQAAIDGSAATASESNN
jgi:outer membrane protein TolC